MFSNNSTFIIWIFFKWLEDNNYILSTIIDRSSLTHIEPGSLVLFIKKLKKYCIEDCILFFMPYSVEHSLYQYFSNNNNSRIKYPKTFFYDENLIDLILTKTSSELISSKHVVESHTQISKSDEFLSAYYELTIKI